MAGGIKAVGVIRNRTSLVVRGYVFVKRDLWTLKWGFYIVFICDETFFFGFFFLSFKDIKVIFGSWVL